MEDYEMLVMTAPTVDITNTDNTKMSEHVIEQRVIESSKNMFVIAEQALMENNNLKKVIIMEHPPRFDKNKSKLVQVANNAMNKFHANSPYKDMIVVGHHSLECLESSDTHM